MYAEILNLGQFLGKVIEKRTASIIIITSQTSCKCVMDYSFVSTRNPTDASVSINIIIKG